MADVPITINVNPNGIRVNPEPARVNPNNQAVWQVVPANTPFSVDFAESPFRSSRFDNAHNQSGKPTVAPDPNKPYKYTVTAGGQSLDPQVIIG